MTERTIEIPQTLFRTATFDRSAMNEEERTVELSISSDEPYERWFGKEILDHKAECIQMERLAAGAPLLFNHDRDKHLGRIIEAKTDGKKLRVKAKFGNNPLANEKWEDIKSGILTDTSVGYQISKMVLEEEDKDGNCTYRAKSWMPYEGSLVTIPADFTVGLGRSKDETQPTVILKLEKNALDNGAEIAHKQNEASLHPLSKKSMSTETADPNVKLGEERQSAITAERARVKAISDYRDGFKIEGMKGKVNDLARQAIDSGTEFLDFKQSVIDNWDQVRAVDTKPEIGMQEKDCKQFSFLKAVRDMALQGKLEGFEREVCDAAQKQMKRELTDSRAFIMPEEVTRFHAAQDLQRSLSLRAQNATTATAGGFLVHDQYGSMIEYLRNKTVLGNLGITIMSGLVGNLIMDVQTGGSTAYWLDETGAITDSEGTFGQKVLTPHRLGACIPFSTQLLAQSSTSVDAWARGELDIALALKRDLAGLEGSGVSGQPLGVKNTTGINATVTFGGAPTFADVVEFETGLAADNADIGTMGFALSAATVGKWKTTLKDSVAGAGYLLGDNMTANGYGVQRTNQITGNIAFFGVWSQLIMGLWAGREIVVDNITLAKSGKVQIIVNELCDFLVRQPLAFNVSTDSAAQ